MARASTLVVCMALLLAGSSPPSAQRPEQDPIRRSAHPVAGRYLIRVHDTVDADAVAVETVGALRGRVRHVFRHTLRGFAAELSDAAARTLARDARIMLVEEDSRVFPSAVQRDPPWGLDRLDQRRRPLDRRYSYPTAPMPANVYVIDSGVRVTHVEFEGRALLGGDFVDDDRDGDPGDVDNDDDDPFVPDGHDCVGHGTHVAATIAGATSGVAKNALVWSLRVIGCDGFGTWSAVVAAIDTVTADARRPAVVNLSLNGTPSAIADAAIERSIASGILYVVAAGNHGENASESSPSRVMSALVVASSDIDDGRSLFSNWGPAIDLFAPGEDIVSAGIETDTALVSASGTSAAAAHATGVAALYLGAHPSATPAAVHAVIAHAATEGVVTDDTGSANRLLYSGFLLTPAAIGVTYPNTRVNWGRGSRQPIAWRHDLPVRSWVRVLLSRDDGRTFEPIAHRVAVTSPTGGRITWLVTGPNTTAARVRVEAIDGSAADESDAAFVIADPFVRMTLPNGGEIWHGNGPARVQWQDNLGPSDEIAIALSKNGGLTYQWMIAPRTFADGVHVVTVVPRWSTARARLRIYWLGHPRVGDVSDGAFVIRPR